MKQVVDNFTRFHPKPDEIFMSDPQEEPEFIKPYFGLRMFPVWHIGSNFLHEIAKAWYQYLLDKGVKFCWNCEVTSIDFDKQIVLFVDNTIVDRFDKLGKESGLANFRPYINTEIEYDTLIFAVGKSGIDFAQQLSNGQKICGN